jgi:hypothetical protein
MKQICYCSGEKGDCFYRKNYIALNPIMNFCPNCGSKLIKPLVKKERGSV